MYIISIYFIIILTLILFSYNNIIEGQISLSDEELEQLYNENYDDDDYKTADEIRNIQISVNIIDEYNLRKLRNTNDNDLNYITVTVNLTDTIEQIKDKLEIPSIPKNRMEILYKNLILRDDYPLIKYNIGSKLYEEENEYLLLTDSIKLISEFGRPYSELFGIIYGFDEFDNRYTQTSYSDYLKDFLNYNKTIEKRSDRIYSKRISDLFKNKSEPLISAYNKNRYLSDKLNNKLKEKDNNVGPNGYIDSPELYDRIIQDNLNDQINNNDNNDDKKEFCCTKSGLDINNPKLINDFINIYREDLLYEQSIFGDFEPYNENYYKHMKERDNIYLNLDGSMFSTNPGKLNP